MSNTNYTNLTNRALVVCYKKTFVQFVRFVFMKNPDAGCVNLESKLSSVIMPV